MTNAPWWPAPAAPGPVDAVVEVPGSKSVTNRGLVLAALADGPSRLRRPLRARDTDLMAAALRALGADVVAEGEDWVVAPAGLTVPAGTTAAVDCGLAGTVMRFVPPVAALANGCVRFDGDPRARERPMAVVLEALRRLGARVDDGGRGALPFTVVGTGAVPGGAVTVDASASSQFVSGLLLAGARYEQGVDVCHAGSALPSLPHVAMTVAMLRDAGVTVDDRGPDRWQVSPGPVRGLDLAVEPDLSGAAPFLAAALVTGGRVRVPGWPGATYQAGDALRDLLTRMGARCTLGPDGLSVVGSGAVHGLDADLRAVGELTPVLAAAAAAADSPSRLRGIAHLRGHETDRLAALARELSGLGCEVTEEADGLAIVPQPLHPARFQTYGDHRMVHAAAVLGLVVPGLLVEDVATTAKTMPDFPARWAAMVRGSR